MTHLSSKSPGLLERRAYQLSLLDWRQIRISEGNVALGDATAAAIESVQKTPQPAT